MSPKWVRSATSVAAVCLLLASPPLSAAPFVRGDANRDGTIDITDPIASILNLFTDVVIAPVCLDSQDSNDDGKVDLSDGITTLIFLFMGGIEMPPPYPACGDDPTKDQLGCETFEACPSGPEGRWLGASACGGYEEGLEEDGSGGASTSEECLEHSLEGGVLKLRHENAGYNCCAEFSVEISVEGGLVDIAERGPGSCRCECLFDLDYEVSGIEGGACLIRLSGWSGKVLELPLDLEKEPRGSYCEERTAYPWGG